MCDSGIVGRGLLEGGGEQPIIPRDEGRQLHDGSGDDTSTPTHQHPGLIAAQHNISPSQDVQHAKPSPLNAIEAILQCHPVGLSHLAREITRLHLSQPPQIDLVDLILEHFGHGDVGRHHQLERGSHASLVALQLDVEATEVGLCELTLRGDTEGRTRNLIGCVVQRAPQPS